MLTTTAVAKTLSAIVIACGSNNMIDDYRVCSIGIYSGITQEVKACEETAKDTGRDIAQYLASERLVNTSSLGACVVGGISQSEADELDAYARENFGAHQTITRYYTVLPSGQPIEGVRMDLEP